MSASTQLGERTTKDVNIGEQTCKPPHTGRNIMDTIAYIGPSDRGRNMHYSTKINP